MLPIPLRYSSEQGAGPRIYTGTSPSRYRAHWVSYCYFYPVLPNEIRQNSVVGLGWSARHLDPRLGTRDRARVP